MFSVSTDYLLKDDAVPEKAVAEVGGPDNQMHLVSMEEANDFLDTMKIQSGAVASGVLLCILCPVLLIFLSGLAEARIGGISENIAAAIGLTALFVFVAIAVFLFISNGSKTERFEYLQKELFETAYGVEGLVKEKRRAYAPTYTKYLSLGIVLCVLSPLPLIVTALVADMEAIETTMVALLLCIVAVGVYLIVRVSLVQTSFAILLQDGDYRKEEKKFGKTVDIASSIYWSIATAIYLAWSFATDGWNSTWILWPVAGVLFAPYILIVKLIRSRKDGNQ